MLNYAGFDIRGMDIVAKNDRIERVERHMAGLTFK